MGFFGSLIDALMGRKVHDDCENPEGMTEDEELETMIYIDQQLKKEEINPDNDDLELDEMMDIWDELDEK